MYWCPYLDLEVPDLYSLVLLSLGRIEVVISTIVWLASVGFIFHRLHPFITFQFVFNSTYDLTYGMEELFPTRTFVGQTSLFIVCLGSELVTELAFGELDCCLNHSGRLFRCLALCITPSGHLKCCWLKLKAHVLLILEMFICAHGK